VWNLSNPLFSDKNVRQALTMAIDRRALARALGYPDDAPISDGTYSSCQFERRETPPAWRYDTSAARQILEAAGWVDADGDGVLDRDGLPFQFLTIVSPRRERAGIFVQAQLARIGIRMEVQMLDYGAVAERFNAGDFAAIIPRLPQLDFRIARPDSPNGYDNAQVRELIMGISETLAREDQHQMYRELADIYYDEVPGTYLYPRLRAQVARRWLRGLDASMVGFPRVERLWIEREY
jgi:peptide/nickel transport system substrate-binding protein